MSIHKLHIFAKNRDAIATQKGYAFQQLKTLEDWLENRIANTDEIIYCDYEDDILARNIKKGKSKFTQIKLYSSDFSFSSEGIKKALAHFFMLYVKGEYAFDQTEFSFETNASIVKRVVGENDAALLKEWSKNQLSISKDLLDRIRIRVRIILDEYIKETFEELKGKTGLKTDIQQARNIYDKLTDEDINSFIKCIKWRFDDIASNDAVQQIMARIEMLIAKLPLPLVGQSVHIYPSLLVAEVFERSMQDDPEDRQLTIALLDSIILKAGDKQDQWYGDTFGEFKDGSIIRSFYPGEFQTVVNAARYCRYMMKDNGHQSIWANLLTQYYTLADTPYSSKRKAIYEYLFLKIADDPWAQNAESPIAGDVEIVKFFIDHWEHRSSLRDIEDDITLLQLLKSQTIAYSLTITKEILDNFRLDIEKYLDAEISGEMNIDRECELLELRGHIAVQNEIDNPVENFKGAFEYYRKIPPLLGHAQYYSLAKLYDEMEEMVKMLINLEIDDGLIAMMDDFIKEIQPYAEKTGLRHKAAHQKVERAALYLKKNDVGNYLQALNLFQEAKELWRLEYFKDGYILSLLNIAQVYHSLGMSYAAKYYAMMAFWNAWHFADPGSYKRLPTALAIICLCDFSHGAWLNALSDFNHYLFMKVEFGEKGFDIDNDEEYIKTSVNVAKILHAIPVLYPALDHILDSLKKKWGYVWEENLLPLVQQIKEQITSSNDLKKVLARNLKDAPLNDIGPVRTIKFNALNIDWHIEFDNNETMTAIGESFTSLLQIALCEITRINNQLLIAGRHVNISIKEGHFQKEEQKTDNWEISIPQFDSKQTEEIQMHYAYMGVLAKAILHSLCIMTKEQFETFFTNQLLKKEKFGEKALESASFQRVFRRTVGNNLFEAEKRSSFSSLLENAVPIVYPKFLFDSVKGSST